MNQQQLRILVIGAHPDDCEYMAGGTALLYRALGHAVKFVSMTNGNAGHQTMGREELAQARMAEVVNVSERFGVEYEVLDNNDGDLTDDLETRDELIAVIRRFRPDVIMTHRTNDYHTDHRHTGLLVQDASFLLGVPLVCPEVPCLRYTPVILNVYDTFRKPVPFEADIAVDIDAAFDGKAAMLDCHRSQFYDWLPWVENETDPVPQAAEERLRWLAAKIRAKDAEAADCCREALARRYGQAKADAIACAEAYEISEYGASLPEEKISQYFPF